MLGPVKARPLVVAAWLGGVSVLAAGSAFAQATPQSPFRRAEPSRQDLPINPWDAPAVASDEPAAKAPPNDPAAPGDNPLDRARRQVVVLQRGGKPLGMGSVLAGDGRVLTALSILGHGNNVDARFADGSVVAVRLVHSDRAWDLALVAPATPRTEPGLRASRTAGAPGVKLTAFGPGAKALATVPVRIKSEANLVGGDGASLERAQLLDEKHKPTELGSPVIDEKGDAVAILAQACTGPADKPCTLGAFAAPVFAIKEFLRGVAGPSPQPAPPFGLRVTAHDAGVVKGLRVLSVAPRSPLAFAGLQPGADTIVAVDGVPVASSDALVSALRASGRTAQLLVYGQARFRTVRLDPRGPGRGGFRQLDPLKRWPARRRPRPRPGLRD